jgi:hypothetical protein
MDPQVEQTYESLYGKFTSAEQSLIDMATELN